MPLSKYKNQVKKKPTNTGKDGKKIPKKKFGGSKGK